MGTRAVNDMTTKSNFAEEVIQIDPTTGLPLDMAAIAGGGGENEQTAALIDAIEELTQATKALTAAYRAQAPVPTRGR